MNAGNCTNREFVQHCHLRTRDDNLDAFEQKLLAAIRDLGYEDADCFAIRLALQEALSNAAKHGNENDPDKKISVSCNADEARIVFDIQDEGDGYDPASVPDPTADENLEIPAGRGLTLIRAYMSDVEITPPGNHIRMVYRRASHRRP